MQGSQPRKMDNKYVAAFLMLVLLANIRSETPGHDVDDDVDVFIKRLEEALLTDDLKEVDKTRLKDLEEDGQKIRTMNKRNRWWWRVGGDQVRYAKPHGGVPQKSSLSI